MSHVVLLGDSIFDNAAYVPAGEPDVVRQVRQRLPQGSKATLAAVDGSNIGDVGRQLSRVPADATHLVVSVGGNDALGSSDFLMASARSSAEALCGLARIADEFERALYEAYPPMLASSRLAGQRFEFAGQLSRKGAFRQVIPNPAEEFLSVMPPEATSGSW